MDMIEWASFPDENTQGSQAWLESRRKRIGASDVPIIMGVSEWATPYQLWLEKTGRSEPKGSNFAMERGLQAEPKIQELYEQKFGVKLERYIAESKTIPHLVASLDGFDASRNAVVEFKYPSKAKHEAAKQGVVPPMYVWQIQAQIECSGAEKGIYVSFDGEDIVTVEVPKDDDMILEIDRAVGKFWKSIESDTPPAFTERDFVPMEGPDLAAIAEQYRAVKSILDENEEKLKTLRSQLSLLVPHKRARFYGVRFTRTERKGAIDYAKVPALNGVDLEQYRKPPIEVTNVVLED
jgi:putative phage-type endonuclease